MRVKTRFKECFLRLTVLVFKKNVRRILIVEKFGKRAGKINFLVET